MSEDRKGFDNRARQVAERLKAACNVTVVGHIDADGISAASIAKLCLDRAKVPCTVRFAKKVDEAEVERINSDPAEVVWMVDLGSGSLSRIGHPGLCIADHHAPDVPMEHVVHDAKLVKKGNKRRSTVMNGSQTSLGQMYYQLNPMDFGYDGSRQISGAGAAYWVAKHMSPGNRDLSALAVVGAVGDFQDNDDRRLVGLNRDILQDGQDAGVVEIVEDLRLYGRETRPLTKFLMYSDLPIKGISDFEWCKRFVKDLGFRVYLERSELPPERRDEKVLRCWAHLTDAERKRAIFALQQELAKAGRSDIELLGECYSLTRYGPGSELHDAKEFATLLNSCGRYNEAELGMRLCTVPPDDVVTFQEVLPAVLQKLQNHKGNIRQGLDILQEAEHVRLGHLQYLRQKDGFGFPQSLETTIGSVLGMMLSSGKVPADVPLMAFALTEDGGLKVSARGTKELVQNGLDLSSVMRESAVKAGGVGGGHNVAAGATVPVGKEEEFLAEADRLIGIQMTQR